MPVTTEQAMPISNLPPFREKAPFPPVENAGIWKRSPGSLKELGQSLKVDEQNVEANQATIVRAIPDPWAQSRTFAESLLDDGHSMHRLAVRQWRGLLALFALADVRKADYSLDVQPLHLGDTHPLERVLRHLAPRIAVGDAADLWLTPHIVYLHPKQGKQVPIALLNPASLVSPGRTSWRLPFDYIPWMRDGLSDPLDLQGSNALSATQLTALGAYLGNLRDSIPVSGSDARAGALREELNSYVDAVDAKRGESRIKAVVRRAPDPALPELYQALVLPAELETSQDPAADSECRVALTPELALGHLKGLILVDESFATTLRRNARDIAVWGNHMLSELLDSPNMLAKVKDDAADRGYFVITADDLFTSRLVQLRKEPRIPGHGPEMRDMLQPIRPLALLLDQSGSRGIEVDRGGRLATVSLHMKAEAGGPAGTLHSVSRIYRTEEGGPRLIDEVDWDFGQVSVWPDFKSAQWSYYFARVTYPTTREQIRPLFALSREIIAAAIAETESPGHAIQALQAINRGDAPAEKKDYFRRFQNVSGKAYEELQVSTKPFDAVFYVDFHPDRGEAPAGCVLLKLDEPKQTSNVLSVAVDFGSTNSVACFSSAPGAPLTLKGRVVHPILFQDPSRNDEWRHIVRWNYVDFLPLGDRSTPTPTVVIARNDADRNADLWLYRNLIYFQPAGSHAREGAKAEIQKMESYLKRSRFNLKWNEDPVHLDASADFLVQFMTMLAAEAAAAEYDPRAIVWHFSVPDAMQGTRLQSFRAQVRDAQKRLSPDGSLEELYSEGLSAARFILSGRKGSGFTAGTINAILDIGGSTNDITLWLNEKLIWKGSFRLAGRAFFTDTIVQNPQILREIELGDWADLIDPDKPERVARDSVADVGELLFSRRALSAAFDSHWQRRLNARPGQVLRANALVYISGIAWYLGLICKRLREDGVLTAQDLARPAFALCGRGAGMFNRMHDGQAADRESPVTVALQSFSRAASIESDPRPQLFISPQPKIEVAAGMLADFRNIEATVGNGRPMSTYTPAGLTVDFADGAKVSPADPLGAPFEAGAARGAELEGLLQFLTVFEELTGIEIDPRQGAGQGAYNEIGNVVRQAAEEQRNEEGLIELVEPPFITALGALVAILASPERERGERLSIEFKQ